MQKCAADVRVSGVWAGGVGWLLLLSSRNRVPRKSAMKTSINDPNKVAKVWSDVVVVLVSTLVTMRGTGVEVVVWVV